MDLDMLVEIATFSFINDTYVLQSLLQDEEIYYSLKNEHTTTFLPGMGAASGIGLMVRYADVAAAIALLQEAGYERYLNEV